MNNTKKYRYQYQYQFNNTSRFKVNIKKNYNNYINHPSPFRRQTNFYLFELKFAMTRFPPIEILLTADNIDPIFA